ncbi:MAG: helix-turn-helix domain-containing protein [Alphaproteobacteria bacterium]
MAKKKATKKTSGLSRRKQKDIATVAAIRDCNALDMHLEGYTTREIASALDMNERTVYKAIDRARESWKQERIELHQDLVETVLMTQRKILSLAFDSFRKSKEDESSPGDARFLALAEKANTSIGNIVAAHKDDGGKADPLARSGLIEVIVHTRGEIDALHQMSYSDLEAIATNPPIDVKVTK